MGRTALTVIRWLPQTRNADMRIQTDQKFGRFAACVASLMVLLVVAWVPTAAGGDGHWRTIKLDEGRSGKYLWGVGLRRSGGKHGGQRPCVGVSLRNLNPSVPPEQYFEGYESSCSILALDVGPNFALASEGNGSAKFTAGAFAVAPRIETVRLDLGAPGSRRLKTRLLNPRQRQIAGVRPARYATFVIRGPYCLGEVVGYDSSGAVVYQRPSEGCADSSGFSA